MEEEAKTYSCGPLITDHDWAIESPVNGTMQLGNDEVAVIAASQLKKSTTMCNWCTAVISDGKIVMESP